MACGKSLSLPSNVSTVRRQRLSLNKGACKLPSTFQSHPLNKSCRAILDARLAFEIKDGFAITFAFTTEDELKTWAKMFLPRSPELAAKVAEMESTNTKIGVNFAFEAQEPSRKS
jgi:hypothetical protein